MDTSGNVEDISFVIAKKNGDKLGNITNIDNIVTKHSMKEASEFTFTAHKKIGDNCVVGAGSVVMRNVKDNTHVLGNPAKKIDY